MFNMFGGMQNSFMRFDPAQINPMQMMQQSMQQMMQQRFNEFANSYQGNAKEDVEKMIQSGNVSREQVNAVIQQLSGMFAR